MCSKTWLPNCWYVLRPDGQPEGLFILAMVFETVKKLHCERVSRYQEEIRRTLSCVR